jgi:hypothetical protein
MEAEQGLREVVLRVGWAVQGVHSAHVPAQGMWPLRIHKGCSSRSGEVGWLGNLSKPWAGLRLARSSTVWDHPVQRGWV